MIYDLPLICYFVKAKSADSDADFCRGGESETEKCRSLNVNVSVCLLTSRPIPERHIHFRVVGRVYGMYEDTNGTTLFQN